MVQVVRSAVAFTLVLVMACGPAPTADAGTPFDAGEADAGSPDAGVVRIERSLFWSQPALLDDAALVSFARLLNLAARDGDGAALLSQWFHRFATTAHSERALPAQFIDGLGPDQSTWNLPFKVTGIHNRIDLARDGHCGELRVSVSCTDPTLQPFHALFLFTQPDDGDACITTARRWAELSALDDAKFDLALRALLAEGLTHDRFLLIETVEFSLSPWEWRQWIPDENGELQNPPLFQQLDVERLNAPGPLRDDFLAWTEANASAIEGRTALIPERFRTPSVRVTQGVPRVKLAVREPLRQQLEIVGCAACHTTDAEFVQTRTDRTVSPFYEKELKARAAHLEALARGAAPRAPFGPLQANPVLPP